ncbi:hypothetical protein [uncultured Sphingomonas sp.]|uniref:hypothetical protein n=1 Tax=uncultured Sphingomonas sp. TaxID=158754 RepID=UPI0035CB92A4
MLATLIKRRADRDARAIKRLALIDAEIVGLADEDLLDLVDIFANAPGSAIGAVATTEMTRRGISL